MALSFRSRSSVRWLAAAVPRRRRNPSRCRSRPPAPRSTSLESQLSTRLFDRVGKRLQLNEVGRRFLPQALRLLDGVAQLEQQFASAAPQASLTAASSTIGNYVATPAGLLRAGAAGVRVNASIGNTGSAVQDGDLRGGHRPHRRPCHEPGLRVEPWLEDSLIVAAPGHPLALRTQVSREALRRARVACASPARARARRSATPCWATCITWKTAWTWAAPRRSSKRRRRAGHQLPVALGGRGTVGLRALVEPAQQPAAVAPALHAAPARQVPLAGLRALLGTLSGGTRRRLAGFR